MKNPDEPSQTPNHLNFNPKTIEEIQELTAAILARAKESVDPEGIGFDAYMEGTDDFDYLATDEELIKDWGLWIQRAVELISQAATRFTIGLMAAAGAVASAHMFASNEGSRYAPFTLAASVLLMIWFIVSAVRSGGRAGG